MIISVEVMAWQCTACGWKWFPDKEGQKPKRCPRRSCRKLDTFIPEGKIVAIVADPKLPKDEILLVSGKSAAKIKNVSTPKRTEPDYLSMSPSEALRARREWMAKQ